MKLSIERLNQLMIEQFFTPRSAESASATEKASKLLAGGDVLGAINLLVPVVTREPYFNPPRVELGRSLVQAGSFRENEWFGFARGTASSVFKSRNEPELLGGPLTIGTVLYGTGSIEGSDLSFHDLHRRCLLSLTTHTPKELFELRVGLNDADPLTIQLIKELQKEGYQISTWSEGGNIMLFPRMRQMYSVPFPGRWLVWIDDDSYIRSPNWIFELLLNITVFAGKGFRQFGNLHLAPIHDELRHLVANAAWYHGQPLSPIDDQETWTVFCTGGFHCVSTNLLRTIDWPHPKLWHLGGDVVLASALHQCGYRVMEAFGETVAIDAAPSRYKI